MADLNEQAKNIGRKIRLYTTKETYIDHSEINDNPSHWRKQDFIAQVLFNAQEQKYYAPNRNALEQIKEEFVNATKTEISLDGLFEKEWLRAVTNVIYIPSSIRGSIHTVKKVKHCKNEMLFLRGIRKDKEDKFPITEFEQWVRQYEQEKGVALDIEKAAEAHLLSIDNDKVKINNIAYYNLIIDNWSEFQFLAFFYDTICGAYSNLIISKDKLASLHSEHAKNYGLTPALAEMVSSGLAEDTSDEYVISLFKKNYCSDDTLDEAGAILWRMLNDAYKDKSPDQLLILWCRRIIIKANHKIEIYKYFSIGEKDQFNRAAVDVIMNEVDLEASTTEYKKAFLDYYMGRDVMSLQFSERFIDDEFTKDSKDAFDTMKAISKVQRGTTDDYLYFAQSSRGTISYLIGQVVKSHSCEHFRMDRINDLCANIHHKPYLLWTLCFWIWEWRPELIPALMKNTSISSALFLISRKLTITPHILESSSEIKSKTATMLFNHLLDILQSNVHLTQEQKAKTVFNCLLTITTPQFQIKGQVSKLQRETHDDAVKLADHIRHEFANRPNQYPVYDGHIHTSEKYYPQLLKDLFVLVSDLTPEDKYSNGVLDFHYEKFSLLLFLSQLSRDIPAINQLKIPTYDLALAMLDCYTKTISATSIAALDYDTWKSKEVVPIFLPAFQNIEAIDWATLYLCLEEENLSSKFLCLANLTFNDSSDEYDQFNRFLIGKLRNHLKVLIVAYKQLQDRKVKLRKRGILISSSLVRLQNAILDIAISFSFNETTKKRFDIFNRFDERPTFDNRQNELIPELGNVSNYFPVVERQRLINALLRTDIFVRILKLAESMTSEQDQKLLLTYLKAQNIQEELAKIHSVNDFQFLLSSLSVHLHFQDIAKEVLTYWETKIAPRKRDFLSNEIIVTTYRTKLLQAFQANDLQAIEEVQEPEGDIYINATRLNPLNEKDFYKALYYFKNDKPEEAYSLYNDLVYRKDDDTTTIALNRFASKLKWANKEIDPTKKNILITEALEEWDNYLKDLPSDISLEHIAENVLYNRLVALDALERYEEFDGFYSGLNYIERVRPGFLEVGVQNRLTRKMKPEATSLIKEATDFHRLKDGSIPEFITEMSNLVVNNNDDPETFKNFFNTLLNANPAALVKLIPDSVNDGDDPNSYILNCIVDTASDMLSKINAVAEVSYEDKYSDLMMMGLNGAMKFHHWRVSPARGGFSDSKLNNPGEIDFAVYTGNGEELAICEALNISGENNYEVDKHSFKIFNYTPSKKGLFLLVYYKGPEKNFLTSWEKYKNSIQNNVKFPESYQFVKESFIDLSEKHTIAAVRVGSSSHGQGNTLHHVFMNINYKAI